MSSDYVFEPGQGFISRRKLGLEALHYFRAMARAVLHEAAEAKAWENMSEEEREKLLDVYRYAKRPKPSRRPQVQTTIVLQRNNLGGGIEALREVVVEGEVDSLTIEALNALLQGYMLPRLSLAAVVQVRSK